MSNQSFERESAGAGGTSRRGDAGKVAGSNAADGGADKARQVVSNTASTITHHVKELLDDQVVNGARMVGYLANSAKRAAEDLDPMLRNSLGCFAASPIGLRVIPRTLKTNL